MNSNDDNWDYDQLVGGGAVGQYSEQEMVIQGQYPNGFLYQHPQALADGPWLYAPQFHPFPHEVPQTQAPGVQVALHFGVSVEAEAHASPNNIAMPIPMDIPRSLPQPQSLSFTWNYLRCPVQMPDDSDLVFLLTKYKIRVDPTLDAQIRSRQTFWLKKLGWFPVLQSVRYIYEIKDHLAGRPGAKDIPPSHVEKAKHIMNMGPGIFLFLPHKSPSFQPALFHFQNMQAYCPGVVTAAFNGILSRIVSIWAGLDQFPIEPMEQAEFLYEIKNAMAPLIQIAAANRYPNL